MGILRGPAKDLEINARHQIIYRNQLPLDPEVGLIGAETFHGLRPGHPGKFPQCHAQLFLKEVAHHTLSDGHHLLCAEKGGFDIDLRKFWLSVRA